MKKPSESTPIHPRRRRRRAVEYVLIFIGCVLVIDSLVGEKGFIAMVQARREQRTVEAEVAAAREENVRLREEARRLREDPSAIEEIARRELGLIKPGEKLFIVKDVGPAEPR